MKYQDIQLADVLLWNQIQTSWRNGNYNNVVNLVQNSQLIDKVVLATVLNALTGRIVDVENLNDPDFLKHLIQVSRLPPEGLEDGNIYFDWTDPLLFKEVDAKRLDFNGVNELNITWNKVNKGEW